MGQSKRIKKFNAVDVVIIVVVAALLILGAYKLIGWENNQGDLQQIVYTVKATGQEKATYESVLKHLPGDLVATGADVHGKVVSAVSAPSVYYVPVGDSTSKVYLGPVENKDLVDIVFTVEASVDANDAKMIKVGTQEVRVGKSHVVKTQFIELSGTILSVEFKK